MKEFNYTIQDPLGIHARPAGELVKLVKSLASDVTVSNGAKSASASKIFGLMGLGIKQGDMITFKVEGADEEAAAAAVEKFMKENL